MTMDQETQKRFLKPFFPVSTFLICTTLVILFTPPLIKALEGAPSQRKTPPHAQAGSQNEMEGKKRGGIVGDPSHLRGFVLGYDAGPKAGNEDISQNKKQDPALRPEYKNPEQFYRYEYGSRASFIAGFRHGFLSGYKSAFGKMELKPTETTGEKVSVTVPTSRKIRTETVKTRGSLPKIVVLGEDAL